LFVVNISSAGPQVENLLINQSNSAPATTNVNVTIDALTNRHSISSYVYGGAYPKDASTISDGRLTVVRWGGNATSRYLQLETLYQQRGRGLVLRRFWLL